MNPMSDGTSTSAAAKTTDRSVFSFLRQPSTHLLLSAICRCVPCWGARRQLLSIDISCWYGAQQQTRRNGVRRTNDGTHTETDKQTQGSSDEQIKSRFDLSHD